jgi:hypothetical protein
MSTEPLREAKIHLTGREVNDALAFLEESERSTRFLREGYLKPVADHARVDRNARAIATLRRLVMEKVDG